MGCGEAEPEWGGWRVTVRPSHAGYTGSRVIEQDVMGFLLWVGLGASVGYAAAHRRDFSTTTGVVAGLALGPLAGVLFFVPLSFSPPVQWLKCPYCDGTVHSDARVCQHCHALLQSGWGGEAPERPRIRLTRRAPR